MMHYLIPLNPNSLGRFDGNLWSAYVRANMVRVCFRQKRHDAAVDIEHLMECQKLNAGVCEQASRGIIQFRGRLCLDT